MIRVDAYDKVLEHDRPELSFHAGDWEELFATFLATGPDYGLIVMIDETAEGNSIGMHCPQADNDYTLTVYPSDSCPYRTTFGTLAGGLTWLKPIFGLQTIVAITIVRPKAVESPLVDAAVTVGGFQGVDQGDLILPGMDTPPERLQISRGDPSFVEPAL